MGNLKAKSTGEARELIPARAYYAIVCGVFDLGTQSGGQFGAKHQVFLQWELHTKKGPARDAEQRPLRIGNFYTLSFADKANLRKDVESMLNRAFTENEAKEGYDVEELLGLACRLQVKHGTKADGSPRDEIGSLAALDEDDDKPTPALDHTYFEISGPKCDIPREVPEWVGKIIMKSPEWTGIKSPAASAPTEGKASNFRAGVPRVPVVPNGDEDSDDIPF